MPEDSNHTSRENVRSENINFGITVFICGSHNILQCLRNRFMGMKFQQLAANAKERSSDISSSELSTSYPVVCLMLTWTLDSGRLILRATSSLMKMSGYRVLANSASSTSSCALVNVVLSRRCFRGLPGYSHQSLGLQRPIMLAVKYYFLFRHYSNYDKLKDTNTLKRHYGGQLNQ